MDYISAYLWGKTKQFASNAFLTTCLKEDESLSNSIEKRLLHSCCDVIRCYQFLHVQLPILFFFLILATNVFVELVQQKGVMCIMWLIQIFTFSLINRVNSINTYYKYYMLQTKNPWKLKLLLLLYIIQLSMYIYRELFITRSLLNNDLYLCENSTLLSLVYFCGIQWMGL